MKSDAYGLPRLLLHQQAHAALPATGQRRDMLLKKLRDMQVNPEQAGDITWPASATLPAIQVTVAVGYAISWIYQNDQIRILEIRGQ